MKLAILMAAVRQKNAFALVITLIMLVLAAVLAVAIMTNASLDRTTAKSVQDQAQAEMAVLNGLEAAKKTLVASPSATPSITGDDAFLVIRVDAPSVSPTPAASPVPASYYYLAKAQPSPAAKIDYYPLFAGGAPVLNQSISLSSPTPSPPIVTRPTPPPNPTPTSLGNAAVDVDRNNNITKVYPIVLPWIGAPNTQWIEVHDPNDTATAAPYNFPYQRYTFWIEDLSGYVDASVGGNTSGSGNANKRPLDQTSSAKRYQTSPGEIAIFTLFDPSQQADPGTLGAKDLVQSRDLLFTVSTLKQIAPGAGNTDLTGPSLATRLEEDSELSIVPFGYGYKDEGDITKLKVDLNKKITGGGGDTAVAAIAKKINDNLPLFATKRKGGLVDLDYVKTIAASMLDYADADSNSTIGSDYRGYDSYPLVNEIYSAKNYTGITLNGTYFVTATLDWWIELWNPTNQIATGSISLKLTEKHQIHVGVYTYTFGTGTSDLPNGSSVSTTYPNGSFPLSITMQPNEYKVLNARTDTFKFNTGVSPPDLFPSTSPSPSPLPMDLSTSGTRYEMTWAGSSPSPAPNPAPTVDKSNKDIVRVSGTLDGPHPTGMSNRNWRGSLPGFIGNNPDGSANYYDSLGDPRLAYYWGCPQAPNNYTDNSSMGQRNIRYNIAKPPSPTPIPNYREVKPTSWPDRGHDSAVTTATPGTATRNPPINPTPTPEPSKAPVYISNAGSYATLAELGNIYDPAQWNITVDANNRWTEITSSTVGDPNYGGGMSLRIGRPEFGRFDDAGTRAWQLLDLFSLGDRVKTRGLININTASREVLRALGAGVLLNRDPNLVDSSGNPVTSLYPPFTTQQADLFADAVIANRPFLSASQISNIATAPTSSATPAPFFGNPSVWAAPQPIEWNNDGMGEYFAKIFPLTTVHSRNFRVFVTGQAMDKDGKTVRSTVSKVFQIFIKPNRDSTTGKIDSQTVVTKYEAQLPL